MNLYKITYGEPVEITTYVVAEGFGDAENVFFQWRGAPQIKSIVFVSEDVLIQEATTEEARDETEG